MRLNWLLLKVLRQGTAVFYATVWAVFINQSIKSAIVGKSEMPGLNLDLNLRLYRLISAADTTL
jgi:hypothetical protein